MITRGVDVRNPDPYGSGGEYHRRGKPNDNKN